MYSYWIVTCIVARADRFETCGKHCKAFCAPKRVMLGTNSQNYINIHVILLSGSRKNDNRIVYSYHVYTIKIFLWKRVHNNETQGCKWIIILIPMCQYHWFYWFDGRIFWKTVRSSNEIRMRINTTLLGRGSGSDFFCKNYFDLLFTSINIFPRIKRLLVEN